MIKCNKVSSSYFTFFRLKRFFLFFFYLTFVFNDCFLKLNVLRFLYQIEVGGECKYEMVPGQLQENRKTCFWIIFLRIFYLNSMNIMKNWSKKDEKVINFSCLSFLFPFLADWKGKKCFLLLLYIQRAHEICCYIIKDIINKNNSKRESCRWAGNIINNLKLFYKYYY